MFNKLAKNFGNLWKSEGQEDLSTPEDFAIRFELKYKKLTIGYLTHENGIWTFQYSNAFKAQSTLTPLPDFPDLNKAYSNRELFPFFVLRIPGVNQPKVKQTIQEENIDKDNEAQLLKRFGRFTIANPYELLAVA